jgi:hypothetical protein
VQTCAEAAPVRQTKARRTRIFVENLDMTRPLRGKNELLGGL